MQARGTPGRSAAHRYCDCLTSVGFTHTACAMTLLPLAVTTSRTSFASSRGTLKWMGSPGAVTAGERHRIVPSTCTCGGRQQAGEQAQR